MNHEPGPDPHDALEERIVRVLTGTAQYRAPQDIEARVWNHIQTAAEVPWWRRRVPEWPVLAQVCFAATGLLAAVALVLARPVPVLQQPAADLHATLNVLAVFHRLTTTVAASVPDSVWYGGIAVCAAAYGALFYLIALGYRLLQAPVACD